MKNIFWVERISELGRLAVYVVPTSRILSTLKMEVGTYKQHISRHPRRWNSSQSLGNLEGHFE
jgi:hypothetical protein